MAGVMGGFRSLVGNKVRTRTNDQTQQNCSIVLQILITCWWTTRLLCQSALFVQTAAAMRLQLLVGSLNPTLPGPGKLHRCDLGTFPS